MAPIVETNTTESATRAVLVGRYRTVYDVSPWASNKSVPGSDWEKSCVEGRITATWANVPSVRRKPIEKDVIPPSNAERLSDVLCTFERINP
jgi:hypothetical protein